MKNVFEIFLFLLLASVSRSHDVVNLYLIPHSHTDAGWLYTMEEYYQNKVERILTSLTQSLMDQPDYKFVWSDIAFFHRWW